MNVHKCPPAAAALLALLVAVRTAAAEPSEPRRWYGDLTLLTDGAALALFLSSVAVNDRGTGQAVLVGSGVVYLLGAPVVHLTRPRGLAALGSLGLRLGMPAIGGFLGAQLSGLAAPNDGDEVVIGTVLGLLGGFATAIVLDAAVVAWQPLPSSEGATAASDVRWSPSLVLTNTHAGLGVTAQF
jgi:hypothetical protein